MKIYHSNIFDKEAKETLERTIALLENEEEVGLYENECYDALLQDTPYTDDDIYYYVGFNDEEEPVHDLTIGYEADIFVIKNIIDEETY